MNFCTSHLTCNIFNIYMRRFFFGLVYNSKHCVDHDFIGIIIPLPPPQTLWWVYGFHVVRPSITFCFLNILKSHCWIFIKPCKHVHISGLPRSGKKFWKMKNVPGQGKVREFHFQSGKFRKNEKSWKSQGISKNSKKLLVNWLLVFHKLQAILEKECFLT